MTVGRDWDGRCGGTSYWYRQQWSERSTCGCWVHRWYNCLLQGNWGKFICYRNTQIVPVLMDVQIVYTLHY